MSSNETTDGLSRRGMVSTLALSGASVAVAGAAIATEGKPYLPTFDDKGAVHVNRAFVRISEGLVHYRNAGTPPKRGSQTPLYMVHGGPGSSRSMEGFLRALGSDKRYVVAPDTLGYGDSAAPDPNIKQPEIDYYADSVARIIDAMGLEQVDFYGSHTGVHVGTELALRHPKKVRRLIFDGITFFSPEEQKDYLANYAPAMQPDQYGRQLDWAWHFIRDMALFFPHFNHSAEARLNRGAPSAAQAHNSVLEVLKALTTYHLSYNAVFRHDIKSLLPKLTHPVLCVTSTSDPNIRYLEDGAAMIKGSQKYIVDPATVTDRGAARMREFLEA